MFDSMIGDILNDAFGKSGNKIEYHDYYKYRISYTTQSELNLIFIFVTGLTDNFDNIKKELIKCKKEFLNLFEDILLHKYDSKTFEVFDPTIDSIHRNLRPKISLVGFSGVGKTTITRLIKAEEIPMQHIPTITGDIATIRIGKLYFHLWDFAGQEQFSYLWNNFIKGSDAVLLISDSSLENVEKSKFFLELIKEQAAQAHTAIIANKQDLSDAMKPEQIEKILGLKTYSMIAKESKNRDKMIQIIADILEMSAEVSPLLKPLLERDTLIEKATNSLENAEFTEAAGLFEKISDLCIELGDDSLGREFFQKAQKIKAMLGKTTKPVQAPPEPEITPPPVEKVKVATTPMPPPIKTEKKPVVQQLPPQNMKKPTLPPGPSPTPEETSETVPADNLKEPTLPGTPPSPPTLSAPQPPPMPPPLSTTSPPPALKKPVPTVPAAKIELKPPSASPPKAFSGLEKALDDSHMAEPKKEMVTTPISPKPMMAPEPPVPSGEEKLIDADINLEHAGLQLNPDDFIVKQRPKTVTVVPKDAKNKLKTSPYDVITNTPSSSPMSPQPVAPFRLLEKEESAVITPPLTPEAEQVNKDMPTPSIPKQPKVTTIPIQKQAPPAPTPGIPPSPTQPTTRQPIQPTPTQVKQQEISTHVEQAPSKMFQEMSQQQKSELEKSLMDLKIKKANLSKIALDYDMKELTGEITADELNEKKQKLEKIVESVNNQIKDLEQMLKQD
jgi:small GTP-binding protein